MFKPRKICAGLYEVDTELGTFQVFGAIQGYGDYGWQLIEPNGFVADVFPTKQAVYEVIRSYVSE